MVPPLHTALQVPFCYFSPGERQHTEGAVVESSETPKLPEDAMVLAGAIVMRVHRVRGEVVVAACDGELLGTSLHVGKTLVPVSDQFYGRRVVTREEFELFIGQGTIVNLLGARTLDWARRAGLIDEGAVGTLGGVPHAEIVSM